MSSIEPEPQHWLLRVGDGENFKNSSKLRIWGIKATPKCGEPFIKNVRKNDILWFVTNKSKGLLIAVATFKSSNERELGPLISITRTNRELNWSGGDDVDTGDDDYDGGWNIEIHYKDLYNITSCNLLSKILSPLTIRKYNPEKCHVDLKSEYPNIKKYASITDTFN